MTLTPTPTTGAKRRSASQTIERIRRGAARVEAMRAAVEATELRGISFKGGSRRSSRSTQAPADMQPCVANCTLADL